MLQTAYATHRIESREAFMALYESMPVVEGEDEPRMNIIAFRKGMMLKGALLSGKICTTVLFVSLIIMVLTPHIYLTNSVVLGVTMVDVTFLLIAFADYALTYYKHKPILQKLSDQDQTT